MDTDVSSYILSHEGELERILYENSKLMNNYCHVVGDCGTQLGLPFHQWFRLKLTTYEILLEEIDFNLCLAVNDAATIEIRAYLVY